MFIQPDQSEASYAHNNASKLSDIKTLATNIAMSVSRKADGMVDTSVKDASTLSNFVTLCNNTFEHVIREKC